MFDGKSVTAIDDVLDDVQANLDDPDSDDDESPDYWAHVLREGRLARAGAEPTTACGSEAEAEATHARRSAFLLAREARARLRAALERVPMGVLCDHWAFAIESAADRGGGPSPLSARQTGRLMRPAAVGRERRAPTAEPSPGGGGVEAADGEVEVMVEAAAAEPSPKKMNGVEAAAVSKPLSEMALVD